MRGTTAFTAALVTLCSVATALPAHAAPPPPVAGISLASKVDNPTHLNAGFTLHTVVSWSGEAANVDGVVACLVRGHTPSTDPSSCEIRADVPAPATHTSRLRLLERSAYAVSVFAYSDAADREYSSPVTSIWEGSALHGKRFFNVTYGNSVTLRTTLSDRRTGDPLPNESLTLVFAKAGSNRWRNIGTFTTDATGTASMRLRQPREGGVYTWRYNGGPRYLGAFREINVLVGNRVTAHLTRSHAAPGESVRLYGIVRPTGQHVRVELSEYTAAPCNAYLLTGQKVTAKRQQLPSGRITFGYVMTISRSSPGQHKFEAYSGGGSSPSVTLTVGANTRGTSRSAPAAPSC